MNRNPFPVAHLLFVIIVMAVIAAVIGDVASGLAHHVRDSLQVTR